MRFLSTKTHGILDYITGALLLGSPWLFGFGNGSAAQWTILATGLLLLLTTLFTDYEPSLVEFLPVPVHLTTDLILGIFLMTSPWIFGFSAAVFSPHLCLGLFIVLTAMVTKLRSARVHEFMLTYQQYIAS